MYRLVATSIRQAYKPMSSLPIKNSLNVGTSLQSYSTYKNSFIPFKIKPLTPTSYVLYSTLNEHSGNVSHQGLLKKLLNPKLDKTFQLNEHHENIKIKSHKWSEKNKLFSNVKELERIAYKSDFSKLASYSLSFLKEETILEVAKLILWLFSRDILLDYKQKEYGTKWSLIEEKDIELINIIKSKNGTKIPFIKFQEYPILDIIYEKFDDKNNAFMLSRFCKSLDDYFQSNKIEAFYRDEHIIPELEDYKEFRIYTSAVHVYYDFIDLVDDDVRLKDQDFYSNILFTRLRNISALIVGIDNDLFSIQKELKKDYPENIIYIFLKNENLPIEKAMIKTIEYRELLLNTYDKLKGTVKSLGSTFDTHINIMDHLIVGNKTWSSKTLRYSNKNESTGN